MPGDDAAPAKAPTVSFSFGGKAAAVAAPTATAVLRKPATSRLTNDDDDDGQQAELITGVEGSEIQSVAPKKKAEALVIPCPDYKPAAASGATSTAAGSQPSGDGVVQPDTSLEDQAVKAVLEDTAQFNEQSAASNTADIEAIPLLLRNQIPGVDEAKDDTEKYKLDVESRPDEASLDVYDQVPIEQFGAAMLRGMGWKEGEAIGGINKGLAEPIMFVPRNRGEGLGATKDESLKPGKKGKRPRIARPGESKQQQGRMVAPTGPDGRVRHVVGISETLVERDTLEIKPGAYVLITDGVHKGHCGQIVCCLDDDLEVKLALGSENVGLEARQVRPIGASDYKRLRRERASGAAAPSDSSSRDGRSKSSSKKHDKRPKEPAWLFDNIRVRIISERYKRGKYYNKKVRITDVLSPYLCTCATDDGVVLEDLRQKDLETIVPKAVEAPVLIVGGKYRGTRGRVVKRESSKSRVHVQLLGEGTVKQVSFDDVAEYVGPMTHEDF